MLFRSLVRAVLCLIISFPLLVFSLPPVAWANTHQRQYIALLLTENHPFNQHFLQALRQNLTHFELTTLNRPLNSEPGSFLLDFKRWQKSQGGELPLLQDASLVQIGAQEVSGLELRHLAQAAFTLVPIWNQGALTLTGPHKRLANDSTYWTIDVESVLTLNLAIFRMDGDDAKLIGTPTQSWTLRKEIVIPDMERLLVLISQATGVQVDLENPSQAALILETLKKVQPFREITQADPSQYLQSEMAEQLKVTSFENLMVALQGMPELSKTSPLPFSKNRLLGLTPLLRAGTTTLGVMGYQPQYFVPQGQLELQYDVGALWGFPDFLLTLSGGAVLPQPAFLMLAQPTFPGLGIPGGGLPNPTAQFMAYQVELGLLKYFPFNAWRFSLGLRGGVLGGLLMQASSPFPNPLQPDPSAMAFGGTALLGVAYQFSPQLRLGLDAGFRYFDGGQWLINTGFPSPFQPLLQNPLQSIGPDLSLYAAYTF